MKMSKRETDIQSLTVPSYIFMEFIDLTMRYRKLKWPMKKKITSIFIFCITHWVGRNALNYILS